MSGIAGCLRLDGGTVDPAPLERAAGQLACRGSDGRDSWHRGPIGLAHAHFWCVPEDLGEVQPLEWPGEALRIAADARIDNREELLDELDRARALDRQVKSDAEIILAAYRAWDVECLSRLVGDFAFALWDGRRRRLLLARDALGIRQLHYAVADDTLYFGTTVGAVLAQLPSPPALNGALIREFLEGSFGAQVCETVWEGIARLPPAHCLEASDKGLRQRLYYQLGGEDDVGCVTREEWVEEFRRRFREAVRCRMRSTTPVAALVSGGLDSSAIACSAWDLRQETGARELRLYSMVFPQTPTADEEGFFRQVTQWCPGAISRTVDGDDCWALRGWGGEQGYPFEEPEVYLLQSQTDRLFTLAAAEGCRTVLVGDGGNQVLADALYHLPRGLRLLSWRDLPAELPHFRAASKLGVTSLLARALLGPVLPQAARGRLRRLRRGPRPWLVERDRGRGDRRCELPAGWLGRPDLDQAGRLVCSFLRAGFDRVRYATLDAAAARAGVEWRLPFLDRRLVDLLVRVPHRLRCWRGEDRVILREAMRGAMPEELRVRHARSHVQDLVHRGLRERERGAVEALLDKPCAERLGFVVGRPLRQAFEAYWRHESEGLELHGFILLEAWLRKSAV